MNDKENRLLGECAYLMDKICDHVEKWDGGWDELLNMIAVIDNQVFTDEKEAYYKFYKFLRNIYWRIMPWDAPQPFNQVRKKDVLADTSSVVKHEEGFSIWNYDYKMYLWAREKGFIYGLNPSMIDIAKSKLTPAEIKRFESKAEAAI